ncbi:somatostatin receptor type 4-like [Schistocerca gregaria]|uniref:somatostatin receptor type 4-like n=1 Tax=Schistocerca gregaria TaxID=7010 RepID=UPI00211DD066|nr:somatostatin receptor type 4-like [Schistocerca gregaria]
MEDSSGRRAPHADAVNATDGPALNATGAGADYYDLCGSVELDAVQSVAVLLNLYYIPVLCVVGCAGNVASVLVFFGTKLCKLSSSFYLGALAVSDSLFLLAVLGAWALSVLELAPSAAYCKATVAASNLCSLLSAWLVVAFTVERFVAVRYPLRRPAVCTVARAKSVLAALTALALAATAPSLFFVTTVRGPCRQMCGIADDWLAVARVLNEVDTFASMVLPFTAIAALNAAICATVWRLARVRLSMTRGRRRSSSLAHQPPPRASTADSSQTKVTKMLLVVSSVFLVLNLPSYVLRIIAFSQSPELTDSTGWLLAALQHVANPLFYTNFGINFALYCASGQNFRRALAAMCCPRLLRRRRPDSTQGTVSEFYLRPSGSGGRRRTVTINGFQAAGSWRDAHEMLPLTK